ncbi:GNAT family N-acetyltransferase [Peribacillus kribbensis]|uniref:GNAT family N-acetyltransferase n=1 Tax=Peribacillus kribbensis TaxID=356658 RepID=UPI00041F8CE9|nr:GNAT family N-acetyltransferase [Peribacillus kribbensis]
MESIEIRTLTDMKDLEDVRRLESEIWGAHDSIPSHQTLTAVKNGGMVLGAYDGGRLAGFQYSFPGFNGTSVYLCSHILGTHPDYRNQGIGEKLKLAQRKEALKLGYSLITWTYDPLESINGYLNIGKLGGTCSQYVENCYGEMEDLLNRGLPSDRFLVEWDISEAARQIPRPEDELQTAAAESLISWHMENGLPIPLDIKESPLSKEEFIYTAIPADFRRIRETSPDTALAWRMKTRMVFSRLFQEGWSVVRFLKGPKESPVHFYVLTKNSNDEVYI